MANKLQPKCIKILEKEYNAYVINLNVASRAGNMDLIACIKGQFYGFEIKWKNDVPSELQKDKINCCIEAGGKAYFIRSEDELRCILEKRIQPHKYKLKSTVTL